MNPISLVLRVIRENGLVLVEVVGEGIKCNLAAMDHKATLAWCLTGGTC